MAINLGLDILKAGIEIRAPRGKTGRLARSVRKTKVKNDHKRHRLTGRVIVTAPYAVYVEVGTRHNRAQPFVWPTSEIDGPVAVAAMMSILEH